MAASATSSPMSSPPPNLTAFNPYAQDVSSDKESGRFIQPYPQARRGAFGPKFYWSASSLLGFRERSSLVLCIILGGALLGFSLANTPLLDPKRMPNTSTPGEWYWFQRALYKPSYAVHLWLSILGGIFVGAQFVPMIRQRIIVLHRINGGFVLITLIPANVTGAIVGRHVQGGEINAQIVYYLLGVLTVGAFIIGFIYARIDTTQHRKFMMRGIVYFSVAITAKLIHLCARQIVTRIGDYYAVWRCEEIGYVLGSYDAVTAQFPQCVNDYHARVAVHADVNAGRLGRGSASRVVQGMSLWLATLIHVVGVELYFKVTDKANHHRRGCVLVPEDDIGDSTDNFHQSR